MTDDPEPAPLGQVETYLFSEGAVSHGSFDEPESGFEANYGAGTDVQLSFATAFAHDAGALRWSSVEFGLKYRFAHDAGDGTPQASLYPSVEFSADGTVGAQLPVWLQKDFGAWSVFGGGGPQVSSGAHRRAFWFGGFAVTREIGDRLRLGTEIYGETAELAGETGVAGWRVAATQDLDDHFSILASLGPQWEGGGTRLAYYVALGWHG